MESHGVRSIRSRRYGLAELRHVTEITVKDKHRRRDMAREVRFADLSKVEGHELELVNSNNGLFEVTLSLRRMQQ